MELVKEDWGRVIKISKYDGEEYLSMEYTLDEASKADLIKRERLEDEGYDVEGYDQKHHELTQEYLTKYSKMNDTFERLELYEKYEQKKKNLAKEFFGIELENVVMY